MQAGYPYAAADYPERMRMRVPLTMTRRNLLVRAGAGAGTALLARPMLGRAFGAMPTAPVGLPTPADVRRDFQTMVDFGPRLTATGAHNRYIEWLEREFVAAGLELRPCDVYETERWEMQNASLRVAGAGSIPVSAYYVRSQETPADGITGPLVYGGVLPAPSMNGADLGALQAGLERYPDDLVTWAHGAAGLSDGSAQGSVLVVDLPMPLPLTASAFLPLATFLHWRGHSEADWALSDYKRLWIMPGLGVPLAPFQSVGAAAVVFICDASPEALKGLYAPFTHGFEPLPALYVDRDTGQSLRARAIDRPDAKLTLAATRKKVPTPSVTAVLPGESKETLIFSTHTDGQGFAEENGGVAFVQLARYFASLPAGKRLKRTLVFAAWPGHMVADLPQAQGWIDDNADLVDRAAAALTVEHLGASEWIDTPDKGYHATGEAELFGVWTTQGKMFELTRDSVVKHDIPRAALLRPPVQFGVGAAFQESGIPQIGAIAGPEYLITVAENGDMDKLDEKLAARQIAWLADLATQLDGVTAAELRQGDPTLGGPANTEGEPSQSTKAQCTPVAVGAARGTLALRFLGRRKGGALLVELRGLGVGLKGLTVELRRAGRVVARRRVEKLGTAPRRVLLRRAHRRRFGAGRYTLVVRRGKRTLARRAVRLR
jgi:hypothetical protein